LLQWPVAADAAATLAAAAAAAATPSPPLPPPPQVMMEGCKRSVTLKDMRMQVCAHVAQTVTPQIFTPLHDS
jgi:hypothetical protein